MPDRPVMPIAISRSHARVLRVLVDHEKDQPNIDTLQKLLPWQPVTLREHVAALLGARFIVESKRNRRYYRVTAAGSAALAAHEKEGSSGDDGTTGDDGASRPVDTEGTPGTLDLAGTAGGRVDPVYGRRR